MKIGDRYLWIYPENENIREIIKIEGTTPTVKVVQVMGKRTYLKVGDQSSSIVPLTDKRWKLLKNQDKPNEI